MNLLYLCCPDCKGVLSKSNPNTIVCAQCCRIFPIKAGIPDLRPVSAIDLEENSLTTQLLTAYPSSNFADLIMLFSQQSASSPQLVSFYVAYRLDIERGNKFFRMFLNKWEMVFQDSINQYDLALDLGCGTGKGLIALSATYKHVIGLDTDLNSLLLARKLLEERAVKNVTLVQGYAQHLPLRSEIVNWCQAQNVMDHLFQVSPALQEIHRVLQPGGGFCADSHNRYDLFSVEPHVKLRWVGWLPRSLMEWYVRTRIGESYQGIHLLSIWDLKHGLTEAFGPKNYQILFPDVSVYGYSTIWNWLIALISRIPLVNSSTLATFPSQLVVARKYK